MHVYVCIVLYVNAEGTTRSSFSILHVLSIVRDGWGEGQKNARPRGTSDPRVREGERERDRAVERKKGGREKGR